MFNVNKIQATVTITLAMMGLVACAPANDTDNTSTNAANSLTPPLVVVREVEVEKAAIICNSCGVVRTITSVSTPGSGTGVGAVLGGLVGGLAGNQVGGGNGKKIATVAGVIGGAVVGNKIETNRNADSYYEITIDMDDGGQRIITVPNANGIALGSAVTVNGSNISLR